MADQSPFLDSHKFPRDGSEANVPRHIDTASAHQQRAAMGSRPQLPISPDAHMYSFNSEALDLELFALAMPTPNLNVHQPRFDLKPKQSSLRFKLPQEGSSHPDTPATSLGSATVSSDLVSVHNKVRVTSPFLDSNTIVEDQIYELPPLKEEDAEGIEITYQEPVDDDDITMKRHRWGTTRNKKGRPKRENLNRSKTLKGLLHAGSGSLKRRGGSRSALRANSQKRSAAGAADGASLPHDSEDEDDEPQHVEANDKRHEQRTIVFNRILPEELLDPETGKPLFEYARNKIRTTKYTPLTFLPKNISYQFLHNIANIYFLTMIILGAFDIFGVPSPVLAAVPLIVIVIITAIKDAIEDSRRTGLDMEVNNQLTHILDNNHEEGPYCNNNVSDETVSMWRRFKKWNTRQLFKTITGAKRNLTKEGRAQKVREQHNTDVREEPELRKSFDSTAESRRNSENPFEYDNALTTMQSRRSTHLRRSMARELTDHDKALKFARKYWKDVRVGDVLRIYNNDEIPADVAILSTSDEDNCCYVETKNLDGETNLKVRQALKYGADIKRADDLMKYDFEINSEGPHANLYTYQGNLRYQTGDEDNPGEKTEPITINNILLRGCFLRNTKWVIGVVVFTGDDTKIMLNSGITPTKQSRLSRELNHYVLLNFILLFVICFVPGVVNGVYYTRHPESRDYFEFGTIAGAPWKNGLVDFFVALILYQSLVPISLYITIEIIKTAQAFFIYSDVGMYYERLDFPCTPKSWSISDDLGQIEYIFSDKTGTLTQNVMEFKKCTVNGVSYGRAYTEALAGLRKRQGIDVESEAIIEKKMIEKDRVDMIERLERISDCAADYEEELTFISPHYVRDMMGESGDVQKNCTEHFMLCLALCHSVVTEEDPKDPSRMLLKAQSPDEAALVGTARSLGYVFEDTTKKGLKLNIQGEKREYQVLNTLEFNSTRKRMSAIIKIPPPADAPMLAQPTALLICKGADSIIYDRLSRKDNDKELLESTAKHLEEYATEGLRTLCIAQRTLTWSQYSEWNRRHEEAASSLDHREEKMEAVADSIERELILLGGTAIEDRLQDGVPDSIALLAQAGIKLWVLTGDKVETAINIGFSCNLLGNDMELLILKTTLDEDERTKYGIPSSTDVSPEEIVDLLITKYLTLYFSMTGSVEELEQAEADHSPPDEGFGVVIDGDALKVALLHPETRRKFLLLCKQCKAVLCCRVSPAQKAAVVKLVKDTLDVMTLAIGDGSNDVAMIQAADVGVGIAGEEGRQAVMSSDYAIGQFRFLSKLLLAHGRWSYKRFSEMIPCFFYKNVIFSIALFWYGIFNDFDGTYLFEFTFLTFYNLAFTSLPVIFLGVLDQDVSAVVSMLVPQLYRTGILRSEFNDMKFWIYMADGIYQSAISFFFPYLMYRTGFCGMNGRQIDHRFWMGVVVTCIACISCNIYILFHQYRWDWLSGAIFAFSVLVIYFWTIVWSSVVNSAQEFYGAGAQLFQNATFWACTFIGVIICLMPRFVFDLVQKTVWPKDIDLVRECVQRGDFDAYPQDYDPTDPNRPKISKYTNETVERMSMSRDYKKSLTPLTESESGPSFPRSSSAQGQSSAIIEQRRPSAIHENTIGSPDPNGVPKIIPTESIVNRKAHHEPSPTKRKSFFNFLNRESNTHSFYDSGSFIDGYHANDDLQRVDTVEIPLEDFEENRNIASRISAENQRNQRKSLDGGRLQRIRTSLEFPELTTTSSLVSRVSGEHRR